MQEVYENEKLRFYIMSVKMRNTMYYIEHRNAIQLDSTPQVAKLGKTTPGIRIDSWLN